MTQSAKKEAVAAGLTKAEREPSSSEPRSEIISARDVKREAS